MAPVLGLSKFRMVCEYPGPRQKLVELVLRVMPGEAVVVQVELEGPPRQQVGPEEPLVLDPCSLAVVVLAVHHEHIELVLQRW